MSSRISTRKRTQAVDQVELRAKHSAAKKKKTKERTAFNDRANAPVDSGWRLVLKILFGVDDEEELVELLVEVDPHGSASQAPLIILHISIAHSFVCRARSGSCWLNAVLCGLGGWPWYYSSPRMNLLDVLDNGSFKSSLIRGAKVVKEAEHAMDVLLRRKVRAVLLSCYRFASSSLQ